MSRSEWAAQTPQCNQLSDLCLLSVRGGQACEETLLNRVTIYSSHTHTFCHKRAQQRGENGPQRLQLNWILKGGSGIAQVARPRGTGGPHLSPGSSHPAASPCLRPAWRSSVWWATPLRSCCTAPGSLGCDASRWTGRVYCRAEGRSHLQHALAHLKDNIYTRIFYSSR